MSEKVEQVARAIMGKLRPAMSLENFKAMAALGITEEDIAIAAIEAMREPTEAMLVIGDTADNGDDHNLGRIAAKELWQAWIDETLK